MPNELNKSERRSSADQYENWMCEFRSTWMDRIEGDARGVLAWKWSNDHERGLASNVLRLCDETRRAVKDGKPMDAAHYAAAAVHTHSRMHLLHHLVSGASEDRKGTFWHGRYLRLSPIQRAIVAYVEEHPKGNLHNLFRSVWGKSYNHETDRSKLDTAVGKLNAVLSRTGIGQLHIRNETITFDESP